MASNLGEGGTRRTAMARTAGLLIEHVGDETVVYDLENKQAHCLKPLAALVFSHCDGKTTTEDIAALARQRLREPVTEDQAAAAVSELEGLGLIETPPVLHDGETPLVLHDGLSRREMVRRAAFAGGAAAMSGTLITTIAPATALAACSGQPAGCSCTQNKECASGHCCQDVGPKCNRLCCATDNNGTLCSCANGVCLSVPQPSSGCCTGLCTPTPGPC